MTDNVLFRGIPAETKRVFSAERRKKKEEKIKL